MHVYEIKFPIEADFNEPIVLAIGYFDGVHLGHQEVIKKACKMAEKLNVKCGVMTFSPHPKEVMGFKDKIDQITPLNCKLKHFEKLGLDISYVVNFTKEFAAISPEEFIDNFLMKLNIKGVVIGFDFSFGNKGLGNSDTLINYSDGRFAVEVVKPFFENGSKVSSTRVRDYLLSGNITGVRRLLGRNYSFSAKVIHGDKRGRTIGFPTANLEFIEDYLHIKNGVYSVKVKLDTKTYIGVMNVGYKPTFDTKILSYEVFIIDFNEEIYDRILEIELIDFLRDEKKFNNVEELIQQINSDINSTKKSIANII